MRANHNRLAAWVVALAVATSGTACAAAAAAGAAGAIYATTRGVESLVAGSIDQVAARSQHVMKEMNIAEVGQSTKDSGAKREFKGKHDDLDVTIQLERQDSASTKVEVSARKNLAEWDKDYARSVLEQIVKSE
jgi:hypothetical protein